MFRNNRLWTQIKQNPMIKLFKYLIIIWILVWISFYVIYSNFKSAILVDDETIIKVEAWETLNSIPGKLGINENYFKVYTKLNNIKLELKAGNYKIEKNSNIVQLIKWLEKPVYMWEINLILLEWWNIYDIDKYLLDKWLIKKWEYIKYVTSSEKIEKLTEFYKFIKWLDTLEWYLYPDTYTIDSGNFKINNLVTKQLDSFEIKVYNKILSDLTNKEIEEIVNLASIVEKEEKIKKEKAKVAWILKKRLDSWWMIWADATVCYPHKLTSVECKMVISKYIREVSEYNTRTMKWLPKTPIWNPSFETINATLNYEKTKYWFYLHDIKTGKIYYAETNDEHNANKKKYLIKD